MRRFGGGRIEKRRTIKKTGRRKFVPVINRQETERRASSKGELKDKVWNFPLKSLPARVQRER